jgi:hypothetical protein
MDPGALAERSAGPSIYSECSLRNQGLGTYFLLGWNDLESIV